MLSFPVRGIQLIEMQMGTRLEALKDIEKKGLQVPANGDEGTGGEQERYSLRG